MKHLDAYGERMWDCGQAFQKGCVGRSDRGGEGRKGPGEPEKEASDSTQGVYLPRASDRA